MTDSAERPQGFIARRSLGFLMRRAQKLMTQQAEEVFAGCDLTLTQWIVLKLADEGLAATPGEAARMLGHNTGAMTRLIDQLEGQGLIERRREADDRRLVSLTLTPAGKHWADVGGDHMREFFDELLAVFTPAEVETMINLMSRLLERLEARDTS